MASLNAPKKAKVTSSKTVKSNSVKAVAQKKPIKSKPRTNPCGCNVNDRSTTPTGQRRSHLASNNNTSTANKNGSSHTKIVVKCNCGFSNKLYIRGEGVKELSWEKGALMKCTKADEWIWETDTPFNHAQIKVLMNDREYELGENHSVDCGKSVSFAPKFSK